MKRYKHKPSNNIFKQDYDGFYYIPEKIHSFGDPKIPAYIILQGNDWEEIIEPMDCYTALKKIREIIDKHL